MDLTGGYTKLPNKIWLSKKMTRNEKCILTVLFIFKMDNEYSFPSIKLLLEITKLNKRTLNKAISGLEEKRYVKIERKEGIVNKYYFNF